MLFASEPFLFLPLLQRQAKDARVHLLGCKIRYIRKEHFDYSRNIFMEVKHFSNNVKTLRSFLFFRCQTVTCDGGHWNKMFLIDKQELSIQETQI